MLTVLWISAVGGALLFAALAGLVGLMYLLTWPLLFSTDPQSPQIEIDDAERERWRRAAALAVAAACAEDACPAFATTETAPGWRMLHRARRLHGPAVRKKARA